MDIEPAPMESVKNAWPMAAYTASSVVLRPWPKSLSKSGSR